MFSKEKGKTWKITNALLLLSVIGYAITLLTLIIKNLLPEGGDFSNFVATEFFFELFTTLFGVAIILGTLFIINKKINLFDVKYPFSRKFLNFIFVFAISGMLILVVSYLLGKAFSIEATDFLDIFDSFKQLLTATIVYCLAAYLVNLKPIMIRENSKALNFINFISIMVCMNSALAFLLILVNFGIFDNAIDFIRNMLLAIIPCVIFGLVIYFMNFKKIISSDKSPEAFNVTK